MLQREDLRWGGNVHSYNKEAGWHFFSHNLIQKHFNVWMGEVRDQTSNLQNQGWSNCSFKKNWDFFFFFFGLKKMTGCPWSLLKKCWRRRTVRHFQHLDFAATDLFTLAAKTWPALITYSFSSNFCVLVASYKFSTSPTLIASIVEWRYRALFKWSAFFFSFAPTWGSSCILLCYLILAD